MDSSDLVRLPCSRKSRVHPSFLKLLRHVRMPATSGFDFFGVFLPYGAAVPGKDLRPTVDYPETPVLLECTALKLVRMNRPHGQEKSEYLYALWKLDSKKGKWKELARAVSQSWDWAVILGPVASEAIEQQLGQVDLSRIEQRISAYLDYELERVSSEEERSRVLSVIHDQLSLRFGVRGGLVRASLQSQ